MGVGRVSGGLRVVGWLCVGMTGVVVSVRGVEELTDWLVFEGKVAFGLVRGGERVEASGFQENKNQAKSNITKLVPTSLKGTCSIFLMFQSCCCSCQLLSSFMSNTRFSLCT